MKHTRMINGRRKKLPKYRSRKRDSAERLKSPPRAVVIFDTENLVGVYKDDCFPQVDEGRLVECISRGYEVTGVIYYFFPEQFMGIQSRVKKLGFEARCINPEGIIDEEILKDLPAISRQVSTIILVTGDGDYYEQIQQLVEEGVNFRIVSTRRHMSCQYKKEGPGITAVYIEDFLGEIIRADSQPNKIRNLYVHISFSPSTNPNELVARLIGLCNEIPDTQIREHILQ